jgi:hypothetical protein
MLKRLWRWLLRAVGRRPPAPPDPDKTKDIYPLW